MVGAQSRFQTREQRMADAVYEKVSEFENTATTFDEATTMTLKKEYGSMAHKLPVLIRTAGLVQALAYVKARGTKAGQKTLLMDLIDVIKNLYTIEDIVEESRTADLQEYILLTQYSLDALLWFKRFAQSILKVEADEGVNDDNIQN